MSAPNTGLILPFLGPLYAALNPLAGTLLRVVAGGMLIIHGTPKLMDPLKVAASVEKMGLTPGNVWSILVTGTEFLGGILLLLGLLTRPAAFAGLLLLTGTATFHWVTLGQGYAGAELSILWATVMLFFVIRGGGPLSLDARIGRQF